MGFSTIFNFLIPMSVAIDPNCDFEQEMKMGVKYYVYNLGYPGLYAPSISCRWIGKSPEGTVVVVTCEDIDVPLSQACQLDRVVVSLTGDPQFYDGIGYCGKIGRSHLSESNAISIGLFSSQYTIGGKFMCTLTAMHKTPIPTTSSRPATCNCGWRKKVKIVGGEDTEVNEFPSMAALVDKFTYDAFCGASIISEMYSLTAAHCLLRKKPSDLGLLVGDHILSTGNDTDAATLYKISDFIMHLEYDSNTQVNDIAIVKTVKPIEFSLEVGPVCLPFRHTWMDFFAETVTAVGWGFTDFSGNKSDTLQKVDLSVVANSYCASELPDPVTDQQICTYAPDKDACLSDSGGPLFWEDEEARKLNLVGIISYGIGCATDKPSVNTRVTAYLPWILSETTDAVYCIK